MKFRNKPVEVEAEQWFCLSDLPGTVVPYVITTDDNITDGDSAICGHCGGDMYVHGWIDTLEGGHIVCPGDWIITGIKGERYPCKPDIFAATYDPVQDRATDPQPKEESP